MKRTPKVASSISPDSVSVNSESLVPPEIPVLVRPKPQSQISRPVFSMPALSNNNTPMDTFQMFMKNLTPVMVLKSLVVIVVAILVLAILASSMNVARNKSTRNSGVSSEMQSYPEEYDSSYGGVAGKGGGMGMTAPAMISTRNVMSNSSIMPIPYPIGTTGDTAEDFEVTDYNASIETADLKRTCAEIAGLKGLSYVIFENASDSERNCNYTFKVEHANVIEIVAKINSFNPKTLTESTHTIKRQLDDFTSETEILEKKKLSIEDTLDNAITAYDEVIALAMKTKDVESLAKIIDSKLGIIERLTQERININQQLDYISRAKQDQLDRIKYTYFYVNVSEKVFFDEESLKDSWHNSLKRFIGTVNVMLQNLTINLVQFLLQIVIFLLYLFIVVVVAKFSWNFAKYIWKK